MANKSTLQAIRGTRDLLPPETAIWNRVEQIAHEVFTTYGFGEIRLPIFETTELFARAVGGETDIVSKEMYSFFEGRVLEGAEDLRKIYELARQAQERGEIPPTAENERQLRKLAMAGEKLQELLDTGQKEHDFLAKFTRIVREMDSILERIGVQISLRPEATASVCRAYIEHSMQQLPQPVKLYYNGPMFRRERPQKGRYRQFYQIGAEVLGGSDAPAIDAEVIEMLITFFDKVELRGTELDINSIGCRDCRPPYVELLRAALLEVKDKLGADSQRRVETNPLRVLDSKLEHEQPIIATLPRITDHLCASCATHYEAVKRQLQLRGILYKENWRLVRGLDYYMRTTFEITAPGLGSQNAVCGGGRYDGLVELLGGPPAKGIGFAIGEDRVILSLRDSTKSRIPQGRDVYIAWMGEKAYAAAVRAARVLRRAGFSVELPPTELKFAKALERASKLGSRHALILGENEIESGEWTLKTLSDASQVKLSESALLEHLEKEPQSDV